MYSETVKQFAYSLRQQHTKIRVHSILYCERVIVVKFNRIYIVVLSDYNKYLC